MSYSLIMVFGIGAALIGTLFVYAACVVSGGTAETQDECGEENPVSLTSRPATDGTERSDNQPHEEWMVASF